MTYRVELAAQARRDVAAICDWLAERSPAGSVRWYQRFTELIDELRDHAAAFPTAPEAAAFPRDLRQAVFRTRRGSRFRALFLIDVDLIRIVTVRGPGQPLIAADEIEW
jgi:plasmid stabilization system protein ParE